MLSRPNPGIAESLLRLQLERSQNLSLQIDIVSLFKPHPLFDILLQESTRWETALFRLVIVSTPIPSEAHAKAREKSTRLLRSMLPLSGRCPELVALSLDVHAERQDDAVIDFGTFTDFPKLSFVEFHHNLLDAVNVPWSQLKTLELKKLYTFIQGEDRGRACEVLAQCSALERLGARVRFHPRYARSGETI